MAGRAATVTGPVILDTAGEQRTPWQQNNHHHHPVAAAISRRSYNGPKYQRRYFNRFDSAYVSLQTVPRFCTKWSNEVERLLKEEGYGFSLQKPYENSIFAKSHRQSLLRLIGRSQGMDHDGVPKSFRRFPLPIDLVKDNRKYMLLLNQRHLIRPSNEAVCPFCIGTDHNSRHCPNIRCEICREHGHHSSKCPQKDLSCSRCGFNGHTKNNCIELAVENSLFSQPSAMMICPICGKRGHIYCNPRATTRPTPSCCHCGKVGHCFSNCRSRTKSTGNSMEKALHKLRAAFKRNALPQEIDGIWKSFPNNLRKGLKNELIRLEKREKRFSRA